MGITGQSCTGIHVTNYNLNLLAVGLITLGWLVEIFWWYFIVGLKIFSMFRVFNILGLNLVASLSRKHTR